MIARSAISEIAVPFRIMPSRGQDLVWPFFITAAGAVIAISVPLFADEQFMRYVGGFAGVVTIVVGLFKYRYERRFFDPGATYWMTASESDLTIVTPNGETSYAWDQLLAFFMTKTVTEKTDSKGRRSTTTTYSVSARYADAGDSDVAIELGDFATQFSGYEEDRASAMAAALNDVRQFCLAARTDPARRFEPPIGLVVAPMPRSGWKLSLSKSPAVPSP